MQARFVEKTSVSAWQEATQSDTAETETRHHAAGAQAQATPETAAPASGYNLVEALIFGVVGVACTYLTLPMWSLSVMWLRYTLLASGDFNLWYQAASAVLWVLSVVLTGVGVGAFAHRKTITGTVTAAHVLTFAHWQSVRFFRALSLHLHHDTTPWQVATMLLQSVLGTATVAVTQIVIAQYIARYLKR